MTTLTKQNSWDTGIQLPTHHRFASIQLHRETTQSLTPIAFRAGEFTAPDHVPAPWLLNALAYQPTHLGLYQAALPQSAINGFGKFYQAITGAPLTHSNVLFSPGSSTALTQLMMYLNAMHISLAFLQASYSSYQAIWQRITGEKAPEVPRQFSRNGIHISTDLVPSHCTALLINTIGNPFSDCLKNKDLAQLILTMSKNNPSKPALIILDMAYQSISQDNEDQFKNTADFFKKYPELAEKVLFIQVCSTSKVGGKPNARMSGIVIEHTPLFTALTQFAQPLLLGVPECAKTAWEALNTDLTIPAIHAYSAQLKTQFLNAFTLLTTQLATTLPNAYALPYEGGMFAAINLSEEFTARLAKAGLPPRPFSTQDFVEKTVKENTVTINGKPSVIYFTFIEGANEIRYNLGEPTPKTALFIDCLSQALDVYIGA
jgi:aspartate/methionine/tyrosine aminotransferase